MRHTSSPGGVPGCASLPDLSGRAHARREPEQREDAGGTADAQGGCGWAGGGCRLLGSAAAAGVAEDQALCKPSVLLLVGESAGYPPQKCALEPARCVPSNFGFK